MTNILRAANRFHDSIQCLLTTSSLLFDQHHINQVHVHIFVIFQLSPTYTDTSGRMRVCVSSHRTCVFIDVYFINGVVVFLV